MTEAASHGKRVVIAGGSGFLGLNLARALDAQGFEVAIIARHRPPMAPKWQHGTWDVGHLGDWAQLLDGACALVNLAGRSVDCIKTPDHCDQILRSRVEATRLLGRALRSVEHPPPVWIQMSTAHRYGDPPETLIDERASFGYGLAPFVGAAWEAAHAEALLPEMRSVVLRTSFVLGRSGGALPRLAFLARIGLGGTVGHGRQGLSWIHETDMNRLFLQCITDPAMQGAYIATAPHPVSNAEFMRELRRAVGLPFGLPAFPWMVRLGAPLLMRTDPELALYGRYCISRRLDSATFDFQFPDLKSALANLYP